MVLQVVFLLVIPSVFCIRHQSRTVTVGLIFNDRDFRLDYTFLKPPVDIALEKLKQDTEMGRYLNFSTIFHFKVTTKTCSKSDWNNAGATVAKLFYDHGITALLGPPCTIQAESAADLAASWNIPIVIGASTGGTLENKKRFTTLTRTAFRSSAIAKFCGQIFNQFGWTKTALVVARGGFFREIVTPDILLVFELGNIDVKDFYENEFESVDMLLSTVTQSARSKYTNPTYF
ncbi:Receptor-type guanylate cyclase gcy-8 [Holothuria leucospilota]|uniref:Receptor-type guanylate cyclase gcy-8 n=1 Tax=Holothuria leucospilota TaxID=206669 RepID=A0A9Q1C0J0_HOLLE|nr:Receptor-type guanylate cyclase gcy-8 [Holothuria leucospilota]